MVLRLADDAALAAGWAKLHADIAKARPDLKLDGVLVEAMAKPGVELILGARNDKDWGPVLVVGLGGVFAEALHDVRVLPPDLAPADVIAEELGKLKGAALARRVSRRAGARCAGRSGDGGEARRFHSDASGDYRDRRQPGRCLPHGRWRRCARRADRDTVMHIPLSFRGAAPRPTGPRPANPESIHSDRDYGFRAQRFAPSRNDRSE